MPATHPLLEEVPFVHGQGIRLGNDRNNVDDLGKFLEHDNIDLTSQLLSPITKML